ncbi:hypothetical protein F4778DRAFT_437226 [Xylariomycetidae sp. FL2044]|nr:hypothetical protein F4778DRAFT_437226 [Xylariomycetidae sp. FL2044]
MAKSRRNRAKGGQRADPLSKPVKPPSDPELAALREKRVLPVLKDLQSSEPKRRTAAASAVANIVQDAKCRKLLLREQIVHILLTHTLTDASLESRAAGWVILRILTAEEEADFCVHLHRVDVLSAIQHACTKVTETLTSPKASFSKLAKAEQNFTWNIAESLTSILSALVEAQDEALVSASRNEQILRFLFTLVAADFTTAPVLHSTLSCMSSLSEDNREFAEAALANNSFQCYKHLIDLKNGVGYKAVLACWVLHNFFSAMQWNDSSPGRDNASDAILIPTLASTLNVGLLNRQTSNGDNESSPAEILVVALEILASIGTTLQESLEKGGGGKDEPWEGFDNTGDAMDADDADEETKDGPANQDDDEEMDEDEMEADMEAVTDNADGASGIDDVPTLRELINKAIPQIIKVFQSANASSGGEAAIIREHALTALNNISWTVSCLDFTEASNTAIQQAWAPKARSIWRDVVGPVLASDTSDVDLATLVTGLAWALVRTLRHGDDNEGGASLIGGVETKFISLYHASRNLTTVPEGAVDDPFQSLGVKCLGVLGQLALDPAPVPRNREIGVFLVTVVAGLPETPAADAVEALNQLFDIYGDETRACDAEVFWRDNFLGHLEAAAPRVKAMAKGVDRRAAAELRTRAEEANANLARFIQYKKKNRLSS